MKRTRCEERKNMDLSVLPNNNHPEKFLQLDVNTLPTGIGMFNVGFAAGAALSGQRQWQNRVYSQSQREHNPASVRSSSPPGRPGFRDSALEKHITPVTLKSTTRTNPLYSDAWAHEDRREIRKPKPSWTIQDFDRHSALPKLAGYLKEDPGDLSYWLEDLYTPGYDSLLRKTEAENRRNRACKIATLVAVCLCVLVVVITVPIVIAR